MSFTQDRHQLLGLLGSFEHGSMVIEAAFFPYPIFFGHPYHDQDLGINGAPNNAAYTWTALACTISRFATVMSALAQFTSIYWHLLET